MCMLCGYRGFLQYKELGRMRVLSGKRTERESF